MLPLAGERGYSSRRLELLRRKPYRAAVVPEIASALIDVPSRVLANAEDATNTLTRFDAERSGFPAPFSAMLLRTESASSSQIENLTAGPRAVAEAAIGERIAGNAALIVSNVRAMEAALALADRIDDESIIAMHDALLGESRPEMVGAYRTEQVWIGGALPHVAGFVPPHADRVPAAMSDLIAFGARLDLPVLVQVAVAHAQFETIHPFPDGNGRTGRALIHAMLRHAGVLRHLAVPVSAGLLTDTGRYFSALDAYRLGDVGPIIDVMADASLAAVRNAEHLARDVQESRERWEEKLRGVRADSVARRLAIASVEYPVLNVAVGQRVTGASRPAVASGLQTLVDRGVLALGNSKRRGRIWANPDILDALEAFACRTGRRATSDG